MKKNTELKPEMDCCNNPFKEIEDRVKDDIRNHLNLDANAEIDIMDYKEEFLNFASARCLEYVEQCYVLEPLKKGEKILLTGMKDFHIEYMNLLRVFEEELGVEHEDFKIEGEDLPF